MSALLHVIKCHFPLFLSTGRPCFPRDLENVLHLRNQWEQVFHEGWPASQLICAKIGGKKTKLWIGGGGGVEWGGVNIGMKTWHLASTSVVRGNSRVIRKWGIGRKFVLSDAKSKVKERTRRSFVGKGGGEGCRSQEPGPDNSC